MRKIKEVLRLRWGLALGLRQIERSCLISRATVSDYLQRAEQAGLSWPLPQDLDDQELERRLFKSPSREPALRRALPEFAHMHEQLQRHKHLTLQLLWEEYRQAEANGYAYSFFCELYRDWQRKQDLVLRQEHKAGEKMFVDWAGPTIPIHDRESGKVGQASLFVAVLGASSYTYAEATVDQQMEAWMSGHIHALEFFGGAPRLIVPDNTKTGVTRACRYDPDLNPTYQEMAMHYGLGVLPARPYKPRDKAKVESAVLLAERWIIAALRQRKFFDLPTLNHAIKELLTRLNQRGFRKRSGSRATLFASLDQPALRPLPAAPFDLSEWSRVRVNIDYHVAFDANFYSVPYPLVQQMVELRATPTTVEIFHRGQRVASHVRSRGTHQTVSRNEHRPKSHQAHLAWTPARMVQWATHTGPNTAHPEMSYRSCLGLIRLAEQYTPARMEAAAERALLTGACRYQHVKSMLEKSLDRQPLPEPTVPPPLSSPHDNIRGAEYFG